MTSRRLITQRQIGLSTLFTVMALCAMAFCACGPAQPAASPGGSEPSARTTSDGEPLGADRVSPGQKLEQGPQLDSSEGVKPAPTPPDDKK